MIPYSKTYLEGLIQHGEPTDAQRKAARAVISEGNQRAAAEKLGVVKSAVSKHLHYLKKKAARNGYSPEHGLSEGVPEGFRQKGYSKLTRTAEGDPIWLKVDADHERQMQMLEEAARALSEDIKLAAPVAPPKQSLEDLLTCYILTDYHLGMLSWPDETGADWNTQIAEDMLVRWFFMQSQMSPKSGTAILAQLGDFLHWDGLVAETPKSHNNLDADTRYGHVVRVAIRATARIVWLLLRRHQNVHIIMAEGNHDESGSVWLRELLADRYRRETRVTVDTSPSPFYAYQFGSTGLFFHHGHKVKLADLSKVFAGKFKGVCFGTEHRFGHSGHRHSKEVRTDPLMVMEQHPTMAAPDAYAANNGYISPRSASAITYHRDHGEVSRSTVTPEMVS